MRVIKYIFAQIINFSIGLIRANDILSVLLGGHPNVNSTPGSFIDKQEYSPDNTGWAIQGRWHGPRMKYLRMSW